MAWRPQIQRTDNTVGGLTFTDEPEFLASEHFTSKRVGITIDASLVPADGNGDKVLAKGTCMGRVDATGRYAPVTSGATSGAKGFLVESVNLKHGNAVTGLIISGSVIAVRCPGLDAAAETALAGQFTFQ